MAVVDGAALGGQAHQREVGSTTADVDDQHQFFAFDGRLIVESGGNRFVLEGHILEANGPCHVHQGIFSFLVGQRIIVDEKHRPAEYHFFELTTSGHLGALLQLADEQPEQVLERHGRAEHAGIVLDQLGAQQALEGAHQPAFVTFQVLVQRQPTVDRAAFFDIEEDHRGQSDLVVLQRDKRFHAGAQPADSGVGRAEVDAAGTGWRCVFHVYRVPVKKRPRSVCQCGEDA